MSFVPLSRLLAHGRPEEMVVCTDAAGPTRWREFAAAVGGIAGALAERSERRWLIHCEHPLEFAAALFAVLHAGCRAVVAPGLQPAMLAQLRPAYDAIVGTGSPVGLDVRGLARPGYRFAAIEPRSAWLDLFTSGSSGEPKRIEKSLAQLETEGEVLEMTWGAALGSATMVATVPHHHIYGLLFRLVWPLGAGRPFDAALCSDPQLLAGALARTGEAALVSTPAHLVRFPELVPLESLGRGLKRIFSSGGPLPAATGVEYHRRLGRAPTEVYGSTESGGVGWREQDGSADCDAWRPFPRLALRRESDGALSLRSPYLADESWLTMGDAIELLPDGRFRLRGRLDRVVKIEGKRISLPEIEEALRRDPRVADAAVVPLPGSRESLGAVVVARDAVTEQGRRALAAALREGLLERFERVLVPRQFRFVSRLPADERGKTTATQLVALFARPDDDDPAA
ncbi:MAG TPA: AMP-binding protein [Burkholderiales bacterium]|nr:AMP-binding protein [Burkholderiales bacterium]